MNAIGEVAKESAKLMIQYEHIISKDERQLNDIGSLPKSLWAVYNYLKSFSYNNRNGCSGEIGFFF